VNFTVYELYLKKFVILEKQNENLLVKIHKLTSGTKRLDDLWWLLVLTKVKF